MGFSWEIMGKSWKMWEYMGNSWNIWEDMVKIYWMEFPMNIFEDMGIYGKIMGFYVGIQWHGIHRTVRETQGFWCVHGWVVPRKLSLNI